MNVVYILLNWIASLTWKLTIFIVHYSAATEFLWWLDMWWYKYTSHFIISNVFFFLGLSLDMSAIMHVLMKVVSLGEAFAYLFMPMVSLKGPVAKLIGLDFKTMVEMKWFLQMNSMNHMDVPCFPNKVLCIFQFSHAWLSTELCHKGINMSF